MSKFNFKSQPCTSREQSTRLLTLGIKKETADCTLFRRSKNAEWEISTDAYIDWVKEILPLELGYTHEDIIPAWSLHRLIEMMPLDVIPEGGFDNCFTLIKNYPKGYSVEYDGFSYYHKENIYDTLIDGIEHLIKEGYFNEEYLEERNNG